MKLGMEAGLGPGHIALDGDPAPSKGAQPPIFGPYPLYDQTAGWIKMPLSTEVNLIGSGDFVLYGDPAPPPVGAWHSSAHVYCGQTVAHLSYC